MTASFQDIESWIEKAKKLKATHLIVVCDKFDHENFPIFVKDGENILEKFEEINNSSMQKVDEIYKMSMDIESQLKEHRTFHF